jgi:hypothetical protein
VQFLPAFGFIFLALTVFSLLCALVVLPAFLAVFGPRAQVGQRESEGEREREGEGARDGTRERERESRVPSTTNPCSHQLRSSDLTASLDGPALRQLAEDEDEAQANAEALSQHSAAAQGRCEQLVRAVLQVRADSARQTVHCGLSAL